MAETLHNLMDWFGTHPAALWWSGAISLVMFVGTLIVVPILLVKMPADYFRKSPRRSGDDWLGQNPALRWTARISKNLLGLLLVLMGISMLVLPGQGLLTILLGVTLLDLPGKRRLEMALLRQRGVGKAVNWLRRKYHRPPLELPPKDS